MGIDYGTKRIGLAVTDPLQIIASGLDTVETDKIWAFLERYLSEEEVERIVIGYPLHLDGQPTYVAVQVDEFIKKLHEQFPTLEVTKHDERFTSKDAKQIILQSGAKKKKRRDKSLVDKVSAVLILQDFLEAQR